MYFRTNRLILLFYLRIFQTHYMVPLFFVFIICFKKNQIFYILNKKNECINTSFSLFFLFFCYTMFKNGLFICNNNNYNHSKFTIFSFYCNCYNLVDQYCKYLWVNVVYVFSLEYILIFGSLF
jgi:hypothetical protein